MDRQIRRLGVALMVLFVIAFAQVNYLQVFAADRIADDPANAQRQLIAEYKVDRGSILAADGTTVLASSRKSPGDLRFQRRYPHGELYAHETGFYSFVFGRTELEQAFNDFLAGDAPELLQQTLTDLILGLPGETYESFADGVSRIIENGQHNRIQFNNLSVLPNAEMGDPEYQKKYGMQTVVTNVVNIHGSLDDEEEVYEQQELVIATNSMSREDWVRTRAFSWMAALLYFDKVFQISLTVVHERAGVGYRELLELFSEGDLKDYPVLAQVRAFFLKEAQSIQNGGPEYIQSKEWLNIWWPADEYILIKLVVEGRLDAFYQEAETLLAHCLRGRLLELPPALLHESILLNRSLIKKPFETEDLDLELSYNIWEFYRSVLRGQPIPLESKPTKCHIDRTSQIWSTWDVWFREVVWWGNKKGAYLYGTRSSTTELAGHF